MLQFLITAYDGTDADAQNRRNAAREDHIALGHKMMRSGNILFSTAIIDDNDQTIGSMRVMQFDSRAEVDAWLEAEPYMRGNVWQDVKVERCRMGPAFEWMTLEPGTTERLDPSDSDDRESAGTDQT